MTFAIGLFDIFTYTIPGALHLSFFAYLAARLHWIDVGAAGRTPMLLLVIVLVLLSYLLGYLAYPLGELVNRLVPTRRQRRVREEFLDRNPAARGRDFVRVDLFLLHGALLVHDREVAVEITRMRATGLMLRNTSPAMLLGSAASVGEIFLGGRPLLAAGCAVLFAAGSLAVVAEGRRLRHMANIRTLELCFWIPDIDQNLAAKPST